MEKRIADMVEHWKKYHWAKSKVGNNDAAFFKAIRLRPMSVALTSFTGNDIVYYKKTKMVPWVGGLISIEQYKKNMKARKARG